MSIKEAAFLEAGFYLANQTI